MIPAGDDDGPSFNHQMMYDSVGIGVVQDDQNHDVDDDEGGGFDPSRLLVQPLDSDDDISLPGIINDENPDH